MATTIQRSTNSFSDLDFNFTRLSSTGDVAKKNDVEAVKQSMRALISTRNFERPFQPFLGCAVGQLLFENNTPMTRRMIGKTIEEVIQHHEPRAKISSVEVFDTERNVCWSLPDMSVPRYGCAAVTLRGPQVVVMGGWESNNVQSSVESITFEFVCVKTCFELSESMCINSISIDNVMQSIACAHLLNADKLFCKGQQSDFVERQGLCSCIASRSARILVANCE